MRIHQWWVVDGWFDDKQVQIDGDIVSIHGSADQARQATASDKLDLRVCHISYDLHSGKIRREE